MKENRAPVPATPFLIQQSLGTMLCKSQYSKSQAFPKEMKPCQGQRGARDEHVQSEEKYIVLAGVSLEGMEHHPAQGWGGQAQPHMDLGQEGSCPPVQQRYSQEKGASAQLQSRSPQLQGWDGASCANGSWERLQGCAVTNGLMASRVRNLCIKAGDRW